MYHGVRQNHSFAPRSRHVPRLSSAGFELANHVSALIDQLHTSYENQVPAVAISPRFRGPRRRGEIATAYDPARAGLHIYAAPWS